MSTSESVSSWIVQLKSGDHVAAQRLWERYFPRLAGLAQKKLAGLASRAADGEDVALSAFDSFCRAVQEGRFPQLRDRNNLWALLVVITARKAVDLKQHESRSKRGGGKVQHESALAPGGQEAMLEQIIGREPTPDFAFQVAEECQRLLEGLGDPDLKQIALWKMEGFTTEEIAGKLGCVPRTVERRLRVIRSLWSHEEPS